MNDDRVPAFWPNPPWRAISIVGPFLMLRLPPLFHPFCRTLFRGFDRYFNPESGG